jgi:hypothetical protein
MRSLKSQILTLWCRGRSYDEIAAAVGTSVKYCQACVSQASAGGNFTANERWRERYRTDEGFRERHKAKHREQYLTDAECRAAVKRRSQEWRDANREQFNASNAAYMRAYRARKKAEMSDAALGGSAALRTQDATGQVRARRSETH